MKTKEANLPLLLGTVNLIEAQQLVRTVRAPNQVFLTYQGGSLVSIFENVLKTSHVNVVYNLTSSIAQQMGFQSALWSRLGEVFLGSN